MNIHSRKIQGLTVSKFALAQREGAITTGQYGAASLLAT
jgi:hypothetical protein